jgi:hypothetical protein
VAGLDLHGHDRIVLKDTVVPCQSCYLAVGFAVSVDVLLTEQWDTRQPIFSASSTMIPAGPRT